MTIKIQHGETNTIEDKKRMHLKFKFLLEKRKKQQQNSVKRFRVRKLKLWTIRKIQEQTPEKSVRKSFTKFTRKQLFWSLQPATLLKKILQHRFFAVNFETFWRAPFWKYKEKNMQNSFWIFHVREVLNECYLSKNSEKLIFSSRNLEEIFCQKIHFL